MGWNVLRKQALEDSDLARTVSVSVGASKRSGVSKLLGSVCSELVWCVACAQFIYIVGVLEKVN